MGCKLSVNVNKIATLRNSRGGSIPSLKDAVIKIQQYGAQGITVHPRPDERHIRYSDIQEIRPYITTEFNIEGNPEYRPFVDLVLTHLPDQVTLVPDSNDQLTSNHGWDTKKHGSYLKEIISEFQKKSIRVSLFLDPEESMVEYAAQTGTDRIELYTESYAKRYPSNPEEAISAYKNAAQLAHQLGLGINAGHDLNLDNLRYFYNNIPQLMEVSIGHALISDALYWGLKDTINQYLQQLSND